MVLLLRRLLRSRRLLLLLLVRLLLLLVRHGHGSLGRLVAARLGQLTLLLGLLDITEALLVLTRHKSRGRTARLAIVGRVGSRGRGRGTRVLVERRRRVLLLVTGRDGQRRQRRPGATLLVQVLTHLKLLLLLLLLLRIRGRARSLVFELGLLRMLKFGLLRMLKLGLSGALVRQRRRRRALLHKLLLLPSLVARAALDLGNGATRVVAGGQLVLVAFGLGRFLASHHGGLSEALVLSGRASGRGLRGNAAVRHDDV
ncbi:hypothetical protein BCR44DRAFT_1425789 [Catenaria anguillulae PL171]|uniref:Uncharacterized protein n=1 Tax=Catenaria anguillulae PL171 TaxID=765915 RepID=A0A1Y2I395_9FUNG|nr:hypothetical protein BCR44DRAFT_1425789 [Catenaria anguillulae PL171]